MKISVLFLQIAAGTLSDSLRVANWHGAFTADGRRLAMDAIQGCINELMVDVTLTETKGGE